MKKNINDIKILLPVQLKLLLSRQSSLSSHIKCFGTHSMNPDEWVHVMRPQSEQEQCSSSDPCGQSASPSQCQCSGIHTEESSTHRFKGNCAIMKIHAKYLIMSVYAHIYRNKIAQIPGGGGGVLSLNYFTYIRTVHVLKLLPFQQKKSVGKIFIIILLPIQLFLGSN